jgi:hypothetical protein
VLCTVSAIAASGALRERCYGSQRHPYSDRLDLRSSWPSCHIGRVYLRCALTAAALVVDPTTSFGFTEASAAFVASALDKARSAARSVLDEFTTQARQSGIAANTELVEEQYRRRSDASLATSILRSSNSRTARPPAKMTMIEAALFGSSRPVLVVPYKQKEPLRLENVLVAWDGSAPAARALGDAMPLAARAKRVEVVTVDGNQVAENEIPGDHASSGAPRHQRRTPDANERWGCPEHASIACVGTVTVRW